MKLLIVKYNSTGNKYAINANNIKSIICTPAMDTIGKDEEINIFYDKKDFISIEDNPVIKNPFVIRCFNKDKTTKYDNTEIDNLSDIFNYITNFCVEKDAGILIIEVK
jgi:hypothetical protein